MDKSLAVIFIVSWAALLFISGCVFDRVNLVDENIVHLEKHSDPSDKAYVIRAYAYQEANDLVILGDVKRRVNLRNFKGHVDVIIISPEGNIKQEVSVPYRPKIIPKKRWQTSRFRVSLPVVAPIDTRIIVRYHDDPHIQ